MESKYSAHLFIASRLHVDDVQMFRHQYIQKHYHLISAVHEFHYFSFPLLSNHGGAEQRRPGDVLLHRPAVAEVQGAGEDQGEAGGEASPRARPRPYGHRLPEGDAREVVLPPGAALPVQAAA